MLEARRAIAPYLRRTPLHRYPLLDRLVGAEVHVKHENHQPIGAFKVRGGINLISRLAGEERQRGVFAASAGNHGQSVAYAARQLEVPATVYVPVAANPVKVASMRALGSEVVEHGADFDEARERCAAHARERCARYVHHGDEPLLVAGGRHRDARDPRGAAAHRRDHRPARREKRSCRRVRRSEADQASDPADSRAIGPAPAAYRSWRAHALLEDEMHTFAEGLATRTACALTQEILWEHLDDFVLVAEDELRTCTLRMISSRATWSSRRGPRRSRRRYACASAWRANASR